MSTNSTTPDPSWKGAAEPADLKERLLRNLTDLALSSSRQLSSGQPNLAVIQSNFAMFGVKVTQADLDAELKRRKEANRDPQATPSPGAFGLAEARKRFGTTKGTR